MPISVTEKRTYDVLVKEKSFSSVTYLGKFSVTSSLPLHVYYIVVVVVFFILLCHYPSLKIVTVGWLQLADPSTKPWVVSAIGKVTSQMGQLLESTRDVLEKHVSGVDVELRQVRK